MGVDSTPAAAIPRPARPPRPRPAPPGAKSWRRRRPRRVSAPWRAQCRFLSCAERRQRLRVLDPPTVVWLRQAQHRATGHGDAHHFARMAWGSSTHSRRKWQQLRSNEHVREGEPFSQTGGEGRSGRAACERIRPVDADPAPMTLAVRSAVQSSVIAPVPEPTSRTERAAGVCGIARRPARMAAVQRACWGSGLQDRLDASGAS